MDIADAQALFEAGDRTSAEHDVELADALALLDFAGGHAGDVASALTLFASSVAV